MNYLRQIDRDNGGLNTINMEYLQKKHSVKVRNKLEIFNKILGRCYHRIDIASDANQTFCFFPIPEYIYGFPIYNIKACAAFLIKKLIANGFHVKFFKPNVLYVYWYYRSSINCITPLMNAPFKPELTYPDSFNNEPQQTAIHATLRKNDSEPNTLVSIPMKKEGHRTINIPLPPINFEHCSGEDLQAVLPPHKSGIPEKRVVDLPDRSTPIAASSGSGNWSDLPISSPSGGGGGGGGSKWNSSAGDFQISFSQKSAPKNKNRKQNYKSTDEYRPSGNFLFRR